MRHHRRDPVELLTESFMDGMVEVAKSLPFKDRFIPLLALFIMSRPMLVAAGIIVAASSAFMVNDGFPAIRESVLGLVCLWLAIASSHIFNDFCDADIDRFYRRTQLRPLVLGFIKRKTALTTSLILALLSLVVAYLINMVCTILLAIGIFLMFIYSAKLKRTNIGFLLPALAVFLIPQGAFAAYNTEGAFSDPALIIGLAGFFFGLALYWSHTLCDAEGDRDDNATSVCNGGRKAIVSIFLSFIISLLFLLYLPRFAALSRAYFIFTAAAGGLLAVFLLWFTFRPSTRNALISYFLSLCFIVSVSLAIIIDKAWPTITNIWQYL